MNLRFLSSSVRRAVPDLGGIGPIGVFTVVAPAIGAMVLGSTHGLWLDALLTLEPVPAASLLLLGTVLLAGSSLVPTHAASLLCGMTLGAWTGSALATLGIGGAAVLCFGICRLGVGTRTVEALARQPRARAIHCALLAQQGFRTSGLVALIRLSPLMPFAATNLLLASTGVGFGVFLAGSLAGLLPRIVVVAIAGSGLAELDLTRGGEGWILAVGIVATVGAILCIGRVARRALRHLARDDAATSVGVVAPDTLRHRESSSG